MFGTIWGLSVLVNIFTIIFICVYIMKKYGNSVDSMLYFLEKAEELESKEAESSNLSTFICILLTIAPITSTIVAIRGIINFPSACKAIDKICDDDDNNDNNENQ
jgi:hypothetical protein